jgi:hypothetical protein
VLRLLDVPHRHYRAFRSVRDMPIKLPRTQHNYFPHTFRRKMFFLFEVSISRSLLFSKLDSRHICWGPVTLVANRLGSVESRGTIAPTIDGRSTNGLRSNHGYQGGERSVR